MPLQQLTVAQLIRNSLSFSEHFSPLSFSQDIISFLPPNPKIRPTPHKLFFQIQVNTPNSMYFNLIFIHDLLSDRRYKKFSQYCTGKEVKERGQCPI
jgi:hypothetical protein